ncbi:MAG TPA: hypothetical protein VEZ50_17265, partial [Nodosilinea sp.]|nr:hypothetical protein [Nodosilinea sp.]
DSWNVGKRGEMLLLLGNITEALADFNRSLELKESDWTFYNRGLAHHELNQPAFAQTDFQKAIELMQHDLQAQRDSVQDLFNLAIYYLANGQADLSKQTYQKGLTLEATRASLRAAVQDLSEFLKLFPGHPQATAFYNGLRKKLASAP